MSNLETTFRGGYGTGLTGVVQQELLSIGLDGERYIGKVIDNKGINTEGDLKGSVTSSLDRDAGFFELEIGPSVHYAPYVQYGTRPHWAPIEPLKRWVRKKFGGDDDAAYAVQWKIAREGTDRQDYLTGPFGLLKREVPGRIESAIADHLE